jgi:hypothetical protein
MVIMRMLAISLLVGFVCTLSAQDYVDTYELFDTPNELSPIHCWYGVGQSPDGLVYIAGSDHKTNSALYQFNPTTKDLKFCGDAVSAATEANNLYTGIIQSVSRYKMHNRNLLYICGIIL